MIEYRIATTHDFAELHRIRMSVRENKLSDPGLITLRDYEDFLLRRGRGWLAHEDGQALGFAIVDLDGRNIWALFVHPDAEGRGIGRTLHQMMLQWYFDQTDEMVWLSTAPQSRADGFYRQAGWVENGTYGKGETRFEMTKEQWMQAQAKSG